MRGGGVLVATETDEAPMALQGSRGGHLDSTLACGALPLKAA